jgi:NAD(P)-dependent dehydrogenase (short-subunit alcohol dehydrogenase family)
MSVKPVALIIGAGEGSGGAHARRFSQGGYTVCVVRRNAEKLAPLIKQIETAGGSAVGYGVDASCETEVVNLIASIEQDIGPIEVAIYNAGGLTKGLVTELSTKDFCSAWEASCLGAFLMGREVARRMLPRKKGTLLFTGATSSLRGSAGFSGSAVGKHGIRALAQSLARELGPQGIHVAHTIIDGGIATPQIRKQYADKISQLPPNALLDPDDLAEAYWQLHKQPKSTWTQELDLRPWVEKW